MSTIDQSMKFVSINIALITISDTRNEEDDKSEPKLIPEEFVHHLDDEGTICIGTKVKPGMILVGKVTPKGECDWEPEESCRALFLGRRWVSSRMPPPMSNRV